MLDLVQTLTPHENKTVPNEVRPARLAIIGEAPGQNEINEGKPFVGASGGLLFGEMSKHGVARFETAVLNVSQHRPRDNDFNSLDWGGPEVQDGIETLKRDLAVVQPNLVLCLGNVPLHVMLHGNTAPKRRNGKFTWPSPVSNWRGSLFQSAFGYKCLAAFHPAYIFRQYKDIAYFRADIAKAVREMASPVIKRTELHLMTEPTLSYILTQLADIYEHRRTISVDIEGCIGTMSCLSIATSPTDAFIVPFTHPDGSSFWTEAEELTLWPALAQVLCDSRIPKILQNCLYDYFVLGYGYRMPVRGICQDTMLKFWELLPELEKGLGVQVSLLTDQPYYKDARSTSGLSLWQYCCTDSARTYEIALKLETQIRDEGQRSHYNFNMSLLGPALYMQFTGMRFDTDRRDTMVKDLYREAYSLRASVNKRLGPDMSLQGRSQDEVLRIAAATCCFKRSVVVLPTDLLAQPKAAYVTIVPRLAYLITRLPALEEWERGELEHLLDFGLNVKSPDETIEVLYERLKLPKQFKKERGRRTEKVTSDALAILTLYAQTPDKSSDIATLLHDILRLRGLYTRIKNLAIKTDPDHRARAAYNVVGTETGRIGCYGSVTGSGTSLQTITKKDRCLFLPTDDTKWFFQCDLSGADGWTVAAHCAALGDRTMLDDYLFGLKPAKIIAVMRRHGTAASRWSREALRDACKEIDAEGWEYFACKRVQHATNYKVTPRTIQDQILQDSYKKSGTPTFIPLPICEQLQGLYLSRYSTIPRWHIRCASILKSTAQLRSASGHIRTFFGRREDEATLKEFIADEPQENTTYVCNLALQKLWQDPENRTDGDRLIIEPLHQVHDALCGQFPKTEDSSWFVRKIHYFFDNEITIAGIKIKIPFEGAYGRSWGELDHAI